MSQYPEPPNPNQAHYTPIYPAPPAPMVDQDVKEQLPQSSPRAQQHYFPEVASGITDPSLQHHAETTSLEERVRNGLSQHSQQEHQHAQAQAEAQAAHAAQQAQAAVQQLAQQQHQHQQSPQTIGAQQPEASTPQKSNRLRKACDSCSIRKVKCDESGPPCKACATLEIPCTFERPSRRRGPPNRHAEAIKKRRLEETQGIVADSPSSPAGQAVQALAALATRPLGPAPEPGIEAILPHDIISLLINDFFTYVHPLCPFPHEPTFRRQWADREDQRSPRFRALLASMLAALVASFPRKPRLHLKMQRRDTQYSTHMSLVQRCKEVCVDARGTRYLINTAELNVQDACTSYFLGLSGAYTYDWPQCRLHFGECLNMIRALGIHHARETPGAFSGVPGPSDINNEGWHSQPTDKVSEQIARRLFWTAFVGLKTLQQSGASFGEITIPPQTPAQSYPPLPAEVDDDFITPQHIGEQPPGLTSLLTGFNLNCNVYSSYGQLASMEMAFGIGEIFDWEKQKRLLKNCLSACKNVLNYVPAELRVLPSEGQFGQPNSSYYPPLPEYADHRNLQSSGAFDLDQTPEERRKMQYEIQKANIYASHLGTRSFLVEKYLNMRDTHDAIKRQRMQSSSPNVLSSGLDSMLPDASEGESNQTDQEMAEEREQVIKDLMTVLASINQVNMEPNGDSFTSKIRQVASTLLEVPHDRKGNIALKADAYLISFLDILSRLERNSPSTSDGSQGPDEESELKAWADLRDYQLKFQQSGGYVGQAP